MKSFEEICRMTCELAKQAGDFIRSEQKKFQFSSVEHKGFNDLVSYVDKSAEKILVEGLQKILPGSGFITEENTLSIRGKEFQWIIDPLDGTTNFVHGLPCYCISIALMQNEKLISGVIYEINLDECFYAWKDAPAYLNAKEIKVSAVDKLANSLLATGFPYTNFDRMKPYMEVFDYCMRETHGLRRLGSAAVDLAYVAAGRFEGFYEYGLNSWDVAAGAFIIRQAGGKVSDFSGGDNFIFGKEIIATNKNVFGEFLEVVKDRFKVED
jgi:myo-inositol-1(or 4)-monophosphatase